MHESAKYFLSAFVMLVLLILAGIVEFKEPGAPQPVDPATWQVRIWDFGPRCIYTYGPQFHPIDKASYGLRTTDPCPGVQAPTK